MKKVREELKRKVEIIRKNAGIELSENNKIIKIGNKITLSDGLMMDMMNNHQVCKKMIYDCLERFFNGDMGAFEEHEEDIRHLAESTPRAIYLIDRSISTFFGVGDRIKIAPTKEGISICMEVED